MNTSAIHANALHASVKVHSTLRRLFLLRSLAIAGQLLAIAIAMLIFDMPLPLPALAAVVALQSAVHARTWLRLRKPAPVSDADLFIELLADVAVLTGLLYLSGGSSNPFVSLYLLPLTITATALGARYAWGMAALTIACYSALMFYFVPLDQEHAMHSSAFNLHLMGMWANFLVSALLIAGFVATMSASIRGRDRARALVARRANRCAGHIRRRCGT